MKRLQMLYPRLSLVLFVLLLLFILALSSLDFSNGLFNQGSLVTLEKMVDGLIHLDVSVTTLKIALTATIQTLVYSVFALTLSVIFAFILGVLASSILFKSAWLASLAQFIMRFARSIHEIIWAWFFVYAMGNNPIAGLLALSIPYAGGLGKQFADALTSVDARQIESLKTTGASRLQLLFYAYLPTALSDMLTYTIFRFEMAIRSTTVLSFVGLGGLGFYIQLAIQDLNYDTLWTYLIILIVLVSLVNAWGTNFRKQVKKSEG